MPKRKIETNTARRLKPAKPITKDDLVKKLLDKLYSIAMEEGNTTAAKIYLDYILKQKSEDTDILTPEEALRILRETSQS
jgi:regulator of sirC expression with transglutaminase-like and TPR domain